jgi:hypothetical protein
MIPLLKSNPVARKADGGHAKASLLFSGQVAIHA